MLPVDRTIVPDVLKARQKLASLGPRASVRAAAETMAERHLGAVLIIDRGRLVGIFTERDLATRIVALGVDPEKTALAKVMTKSPRTIDAAASVRSALELMGEGRFRHLPVLEGDELIGIVSMRDLYRAVMEQLEADVLLLVEGLIHS